MIVVLDTNVLVSGFLNPHAPPGAIVLYVAEGRLQLAYDARILSEYREVLLRPRFGFKPSAVDDFLAQVEAEGLPVSGKPLPHRLPDLSDEPFLEVALAASAEFLITGNLKHFPKTNFPGLSITSPAAFLEVVRKLGL